MWKYNRNKPLHSQVALSHGVSIPAIATLAKTASMKDDYPFGNTSLNKHFYKLLWPWSFITATES